jgi:hypothetical protein
MVAHPRRRGDRCVAGQAEAPCHRDRAAGAVLVLQRLLPSEAMRRAFGLDKLFVDRVDATQRRAYDNRVCAR